MCRQKARFSISGDPWRLLAFPSFENATWTTAIHNAGRGSLKIYGSQRVVRHLGKGGGVGRGAGGGGGGGG